MRKLSISIWLAMCAIMGCGTEGRTFAQVDYFLPPNDLWKQDNLFLTSMTEQTFNAIIDRVNVIYKPIVKKFGANLVIERRFSDPTVNAYAQKNGSTWRVSMFGGLARRPEISQDGFLTVICHEIGHLISGAPLYPGEDMASEGQSDFWASHVCLKKVYANDTTNVVSLSAVAVTKCKKLYKGQTLRVCYHNLAGAKSTADLLGVLNGGRKPRFDTPDTSVVNTTNYEHPAAQCRLDTYLAGALCQAPWRDDIVPDDRNQMTYNCTINNDPAIPTTRPRCWYRP